MTSTIEARGIRAGYNGTEILHGVDLCARAGQITTLIGPNGCGKSTLLKTLSTLITPQEGSVALDGDNVHELKRREVARRIALLAQHPHAPEGLTVGELISRGRHPHRSGWQRMNARDHDAIAEAVERTDVRELLECRIEALSGGQRQRVWLAMTLAQDTPVLLLDEPTTFLDPAHAIDMLKLVKAQAEAGKAVVMVLHDLMLVGQFSDTVVVLKDGRIVAQGAPEEALTPHTLKDAYQLDAEVWEDPRGPVIVPRGTI